MSEEVATQLPTDEEIAWRTKAAPVEQSWYRWTAATAGTMQASAVERMAEATIADTAEMAKMRAEAAAWDRTRLIVETATAIFTDQTTSADIPTRQEAKAAYAVRIAKLLLDEVQK